jgi:hypothetical protein
MQGNGAQIIQDNWGTDHPCYNETIVRFVKWSDAEIEYIRIWYNTNRQKNPNMLNISVKCLEYIRNDQSAIPIFHCAHIKDSGRIRSGISYFERNEEENKIT